ncbi:MAG: hypothetical protein MUC96_17600 [Myxococcaceae bacterium]|jgi:predicted DNA-binding WGR domain protein|nr:hypothetical protein [Myxococcaceae bacterium]
MPRFERVEGRHRAFWQIDLEGPVITIVQGEFGAEGARTTRRYDDLPSARRAYERLIADHTRAGFEVSGGRVDAAADDVEQLTVRLVRPGASIELSVAGTQLTERRFSGIDDEVQLSTRGFDEPSQALDELELRTSLLVRDGMQELDRQSERVQPALAEPEHRGVAARQPEHEAACLAAAPDDARPWKVYGDWLEGRGDVRGALAALLLGGKTEAGLQLLERQREVLLGAVAHHLPHEVGDFTFHHGFLTRARLRRAPGRDTDLAALTRAFLERPFARFVTGLRFGLSSHDADNDWGPTLRVVIESLQARQLTSLAFDDFGPEEADLASTPFGDLSPLWKGLPALEHLSLRSGAGGELGHIDHPRLKRFVRKSGGLSASELSAIGGARWPSLEHLELWTGSTSLGAEVTAEALRPLIEGTSTPKLTHLGLVDCEHSREILPMLLGSPLLPRLRSLDLSKGMVSDGDAELLVRHADRFRHLERVDLSENLLVVSKDALAQALPNARLDGQRTDEGRTVAVVD